MIVLSLSLMRVCGYEHIHAILQVWNVRGQPVKDCSFLISLRDQLRFSVLAVSSFTC